MKTKIGLNQVIRILISSDFLLQSGWGLIGPIFAIFLTKQIQGANLVSIGFVATIYWLSKSIVQPFLAYYLDRKKGEQDDFRFLIGGMLIANLIPLGYLFSHHIAEIFLLELIRGVAMAGVIPSWSAIFTRHIDKDWEAFSWSLESTGIGLAAGFTGALGGIIANFLGFKAVFILVSFFGLIATALLLKIRKKIYTRDHFLPRRPISEKPL
ncbi:MAG: MFS transporter [Minisyncoccales bacterium]